MAAHSTMISFRNDRTVRNKKIMLGFEDDNLVERLRFALPVISERQTATLMKTGAADGITLDWDDENGYYIDLTREIIGSNGEAEAFVRIDGTGGEVWQSDVMRLITGALPDVDTEIEQRFPTAVEQMLTEIAGHRAEMADTLDDAQDAADRAEEAADKMPIIGGNGNWWLWDAATGQYVDSGRPSQGGGGEGGGATYHSQLQGRDADNQHPISAIDGLQAALDGKMNADTKIPEAYVLPPATAERLGGMIVGSGLEADEHGVVRVRPEGVYELIETITLPEDTAEIIRTAEPDGTPYALQRIHINTVMQPGPSASAINYFFNDGFFVVTGGSHVSTAMQYGQVDAWISHGVANGKSVNGTPGAYNVASVTALAQKQTMRRTDAITKVRMVTVSSGVTMLAGSTVEIWGVRANA